MLNVSNRLYCNVDLAISANNKMQMKNKKMLPKFFSFKEMTYLCNPKLNHYTLLLPKQ